jgi:hypothetical protein
VGVKFIKLNLKLAEMEFQPNDVDRKAAWALYVERITRIVLNQVVRPFTAERHRRSLEGDLSTPDGAAELREQLDALQTELRAYTKMLADLADVEDLTDLEANS